MANARNVVVFYTDQQRKDSLGCYGNPVCRTPHVDGLAARGMRFDAHYATNPVCMPSRASFFTGQHPQAHRVIDNGIPLNHASLTLPGILKAHGYDTASFGKLHLTPYGAPAEGHFEESRASWQAGQWADWSGPYFGFDHVELTLGHGPMAFAAGAHYSAWFEQRFGPIAEARRKLKETPHDPYVSTCPPETYSTAFVAERAADYLKQRGRSAKPFFLFVGFPDPHHPFEMVEPYASMYRKCALPPPHRCDGENERKPAHYARAMRTHITPLDGGAHKPDWSPADWQAIRANTYGKVTFIDEAVGQVLAALREAELESNTVTVFTADHGELLGDHDLVYKGPFPCRALLNVPFIMAGPGCQAGRTDQVMSNADVLPTVLELLDLPVPEAIQGRSRKAVLDGRAAEADAEALVSGWSKASPDYYHFSLYERRWRISYFPYQDDGELYDLEADEHELRNLYHEPAYRAERARLLARLLRACGRAEPKRPPVMCNW